MVTRLEDPSADLQPTLLSLDILSELFMKLVLDLYQTFYLILIANLHLYSYYNLPRSIPVSNAVPTTSTTDPNLITASIQLLR